MICRDHKHWKARLDTIRFVLRLSLALLLPLGTAQAQTVPATCPASLGNADLIDHDLDPNVSFCELCGVGTVRIEVVNPFTPGANDIDFANLVITEDLLGSGLTYVANSTRFTGNNISKAAGTEMLLPVNLVEFAT